MSDEKSKRKVRTRGHIIADLGVNFVERQILLAGFTMEKVTHDYGIDTLMTTYASDGQVENEAVSFQVKATDHIQLTADDQTIIFRIESADLRYWLLELMPVILVLYDAPYDRAYWIDVQEYALGHDLDVDEIGETVTLRIAPTWLFSADAVNVIRERKESVRKGLLGPDDPR